MKRKFFAICSVLVTAIVLIAVLVPGCDGGTTGTIEVDATLDGLPWSGAVEYTLTGPGAAAPTIINGSSVPNSHTAEAGNWTCAYVSGGPGIFVNVTPSPAQELSAGGTIGFTLNFVTPVPPPDASIEFSTWTINGLPVDPAQGPFPVWPGDWIDIEYKEHVSGEEEGAVVTVHQTSWLKVHNTGFEGVEPGPPITLHVVNAPGAVSMDPPAEGKSNQKATVVTVHQTSWLSVHNIGWYGEEPGGETVTLHVVNAPGAVSMDPPAEGKSNQKATVEGNPVEHCDTVDLLYCVPVNLDMEVDWELKICTNYTKTINWIGFPAGDGLTLVLNGAEVLFDLTDPYDGLSFNLTAKACVELEGDENSDNDCTDWSPTLTITWLVAPPTVLIWIDWAMLSNSPVRGG